MYRPSTASTPSSPPSSSFSWPPIQLEASIAQGGRYHVTKFGSSSIAFPEENTAWRTLRRRKTRETRLYKFSIITELNSYMVGNHCNVLYYSFMVVFRDSLCARKRKWDSWKSDFIFPVVQRRIFALLCCIGKWPTGKKEPASQMFHFME